MQRIVSTLIGWKSLSGQSGWFKLAYRKIWIKLFFIKIISIFANLIEWIQSSKTRGQPYSVTSPYEVSEYFLGSD